MPTAISPHYLDIDFPRPWSFHTKVLIFADQTFGWQLDIADHLEKHPHAAFAMMSVMVNYFETIAKYESGDPSHAPGRHFRAGIRSMLKPHADAQNTAVPDDVLDCLYEDVRCGLYHESFTSGRILLSGEPEELILWDGNRMIINPFELLKATRRHLASYIGRLMSPDTTHDVLRANFEKVFDARK